MKLINIEIDPPVNGWLFSPIVCDNPTYRNLISYNKVSYWCYLNRYNITLKIRKESPQGILLTKNLTEGKFSYDEMETFIISLALPHLTADNFQTIVSDLCNKAFSDGEKALGNQLCNLIRAQKEY